MEVTKDNFLELLPTIAKDIEDCTFMSMDGEFTGLETEKSVLAFNTSEEVYTKIQQNSKDFILIQLGLSLFRVSTDEPENADDDAPKTSKTSCKTYNFYVYPRNRSAWFSCQGESLSFLAQNGFDFNKLFAGGISYCSKAEENKLRADLLERQEARLDSIKGMVQQKAVNRIPVPENEVEMINGIEADIDKFLLSEETEILIDKCNGFQRKLVYELIDEKYLNKVSTSSKNLENNRKGILIVRKRTLEEELALNDLKIKEEEEKLNNTVGMSLLMNEVSSSKKLIVGHNMLLDVLYMVKQFFAPLPADYNEFKQLVHKIFPNILDTKFLSSSPTFKELINSTVLQHVYQSLKDSNIEETVIEWDSPEVSYSLEDQKEHEAGFDAFLTGYCFLGMLKHLNINLDETFNPQKSQMLRQYVNRIFVGRIQNNPYIFLTGREPTFTREHVFYIEFPAAWQTSEIQELFKNYGSVFVSWENQSSAYVALHNRENFSAVLKTINRPDGFTIKTFSDRQLETQNRSSSSMQRNQTPKRKLGSDDDTSKESPTLKKPDYQLQQKKKKNKTFKDDDAW